MKSLAFPNILDRSSVNTVTDLEATKSNLKLLLLSDFGTLIGDPNYGTGLKKLYFEQNNVTLKDIVIDTVYTSVAHFMPQIKVKRKDITIDVVLVSSNSKDFKRRSLIFIFPRFT